MQSWVYCHVVIGLLCFEYGYLQKLEKECSWLVERDHCPFYGSTDWECLKARLNCAVGKRYHCAKNETGSWVEVCDKGTVCSEGEEPVYLKDLSIHCEPCSDPERYQPFSKSSYIFSQCERKKKPCPEGVSHECANEAGRYTQNRICMCTYKKDYIPQDYDFTKYKWVCADPDDLNCVAEACPESVDGKPQTRGGDYRCSPSSPVTPSPTKNPNERSTTEHIPPTMITVTESNGTERNNGGISGYPTAIVIVASLVILFLVIWIVVLLLWKRFVLHRYKKLEPPSCFNIKGIWYTEVALEWQPPNSDDGCSVIGYILDQQVNESKYWTRVAFVPVRLQDKTESLQDEHSWGDENIHLIDNKEKYKVKGLSAGTSYKFRVAAKNKNGVGSFLEMELAVKTKQYTEPDKPRNLTGYFDSQERLIKLSWEHPDDDGGKPLIAYRVEYCDSADVDRRWIKDSPVDKEITAWSGNMFVAGETYKFRVSVENAIGFSECQELQGVIQYLSLPGAPEDVHCSDLKNDRLMVNWKPPQYDGGIIIRKYILKFKVANEEWKVITDAPNTSTSKIVKGLTPGIPYYLGVCAENRIGIGELKETRDPVILPKSGPPAMPVGPLEALSITYTTVTLSWKQPKYDGGSKVTTYIIAKKVKNGDDKEKNWDVLKSFSTSSTSQCIKGLKPGTEYLFRVSAKNEHGLSEPLETGTEIITLKATYPGTPGGPLEYYSLSANSLTVKWKATEDDGGSPLTGYSVFYQDTSDLYDNTWRFEVNLSTNTTKRTVKGLKENHDYLFRVYALNAKGESTKPLESCQPVRLTAPSSVPSEPSSVGVEYGCDDTALLSWTAPKKDGGSSITQYHLLTKEDGKEWRLMGVVSSSETSYVAHGILDGKIYRFAVKAENEVGCGKLAETKKQQKKRGSKRKSQIIKPTSEHGTDSDVQAHESRAPASQIENIQSNAGDSSFLKDTLQEKTATDKTLETETLPIPQFELPSAPERLVAKADKGGITLEWKPPISDGGSKCICFHIKKRKTNSQEWSDVITVSDPTRTSLRVRAEPYCDMLYSIAAENATGIGPATVTETDVSSYGPPLVPAGYLTVSDYDANKATLKWAAPEHDGGASLTRYRVEYQERGLFSYGWKHFKHIPPDQTECCVDNLKANTTYSFRICAENEFGSSNLLEIEKPITTRHLIVPPQPTGEILFEDSTEDSVRLSWQPPADEGGAVVRGYHVKYKLNHSNSKWINAGFTSGTTWKQDDLIPEHEYLFSVAATNAKGDGPALLSEVIKPTTLHLDVMESLAEELKSRMQGLTVLSGLKKFHIGSEEDHTHIQEASSAAARNERILQLISSKGFGAYKLFKGILFESDKKLLEQLQGSEETIIGEGKHAGGTNVAIAEKDNNWSSLDSRDDKHLPAGLPKSGFSQTYPSSSTKSASASVVSKMTKKFEQQITPQSMSTTKGKTETMASEEAENNLDKPGEAGPYKTDATVSSKDWEMQEKEAHDYLGMLGVQKRSESWENFVTYTKPLEEIIKKTIKIPTCLPQQINGNKYKLGKQVLPKELRAYECSGEDNFLFRSVSCALFGNEEYTERLRLVSVFDGVNNYDVYAKQYFEDKDDEEIKEIMQSCISLQTLQEFDKDIKLQKDSANMAEMSVKMAVRETAISGSKINPFQVQFLSGAINIPILQYFQRNKNFFGEDINEYAIIKPAGSTDSIEDILHTCLRILWISDQKKEHSGSGNLNCILPVIKKPKK